MGSYTEIDGAVQRTYSLYYDKIFRHQSEKSLIELASTNEYGSMLFCNGQLQFAEKDEYIYHEMFVHPCLSSSHLRKRICILGGGDGCALREVLKWPDVEHVDLIDWDKDMITLFSTDFTPLNMWAFEDPRVHIECKNVLDLKTESRKYDCILVDLFDPDESHSDLWLCIRDLLKQWLEPHGSAVLNVGGILPWETTTINWVLQMLGGMPPWKPHLYKTFVPSFSREWCFLLFPAKKLEFQELPDRLQYFNECAWHQAFTYAWTKPFLERVHGI